MNQKTLDPLVYCDACFLRDSPILCETFKGTFTKLRSIHFTQQNKLDRILNKIETRPKFVNRRWTCTIDNQNRKDFLNSLWSIGITVHSLEDHVRIIEKLYKLEVRKLGDHVEFQIPNDNLWSQFDPNKRSWINIDLSKNGISTRVRLGAILKEKELDNSRYFLSTIEDKKSKLVPIERRAAYNVISTQLAPVRICWYPDDTNQYGLIRSEDLLNFPEEIFSALLRFEGEKKVVDYMVFYDEDFELINKILGCVKIELDRSSAEKFFINKPSPNEQHLELESVQKERINSLVEMISSMGGKVTWEKETLFVSGRVDSVKINFIQEGYSNQKGRLISVPLSILEDPTRMSNLLSMIKKRIGLLSISLENLVCQFWPLLNQNDLEYVIMTILELWKVDKNLTLLVINNKIKFDKINSWNDEIKTGKIRSSLDTITLGKILKFTEQNGSLK